MVSLWISGCIDTPWFAVEFFTVHPQRKAQTKSPELLLHTHGTWCQRVLKPGGSGAEFFCLFPLWGRDWWPQRHREGEKQTDISSLYTLAHARMLEVGLVSPTASLPMPWPVSWFFLQLTPWCAVFCSCSFCSIPASLPFVSCLLNPNCFVNYLEGVKEKHEAVSGRPGSVATTCISFSVAFSLHRASVHPGRDSLCVLMCLGRMFSNFGKCLNDELAFFWSLSWVPSDNWCCKFCLKRKKERKNEPAGDLSCPAKGFME